MAFDLSRAEPVGRKEEKASSGFDVSRADRLITGSDGQTYAVTGTNRQRIVLNPDYSVSTVYEGQGVSPISEEAKSKAERLPELITGFKAKDRTDLEGIKRRALVEFNTLLTADPTERAGMLKAQGFDVYEEGGLHFVRTEDGKEYVVNRPGMSIDDWVSTAGQIVQFIPAARVAGAAKHLLGKAAMGAVASGATAIGRETVQAATGGEFNTADVVLDTAMGGIGELAAPLFGRAFAHFSKAKQTALQNASTLDDLVKGGATRDEIMTMRNNYRKGLARAKAEGVEMRGAQILYGDATTDFPQPLADMMKASNTDAEFAQELTRAIERQSKTLSDNLGEMYQRGKGAVREALEDTRITAAKILDDNFSIRQITAKKSYDDAFAGASNINLEKLHKDIGDMIREVPRNTPVRKQLEKIRKMLDSDEYLEEMAQYKSRQQMVAAGDIDPSALGPRPERTMDAPMLQEVNWYLRDLKRLKGDKSTLGSVKHAAGELENSVTALLNKATNGEYAKADRIYREMSKIIDNLQQGPVGSAASRNDNTLRGLLDNVFNPRPGQVELSERFMRRLAREDPDIAKNLYDSYFLSKLDNLPDDARAGDILKAVFGPDENSVNMALRLAPDKRTAARLNRIKGLLKMASTLDDVRKTKTAANIAERTATGGPLNWFAQIFTPFHSTRRGFEKIAIINRSKLMFEAVANKEWAEELDAVLKLPPTSEEAARAVDGFLAKMTARMQARSAKDTLTRAVYPGILNVPQGSYTEEDQ